MALKRNPKMLDQLQYCEKNQIELCVIVGGSELEAGIVKIRNVGTREEVKIRISVLPNSIVSFSLTFHAIN